MSDASKKEQSHGAGPSAGILARLRDLNAAYETKFGFPYMVFVNGRALPDLVPEVGTLALLWLACFSLESISPCFLANPMLVHVVTASFSCPQNKFENRLTRTRDVELQAGLKAFTDVARSRLIKFHVARL